jgi:hypothetical protein
MSEIEQLDSRLPALVEFTKDSGSIGSGCQTEAVTGGRAMTIAEDDALTHAQRKRAQARPTNLKAPSQQITLPQSGRADPQQLVIRALDERVQMVISPWFNDEFGNPTRTVRRA